jgi:excisionase family DNA binding protein
MEAKVTLRMPPIMTVKEVSEYLRVHPSTVYRMLRTGGLPAFRIGSDWRFNAEEIDRWCNGRNVPEAPAHRH